MISLLGLAALGAAAKLSRDQNLSGPVGDEFCSAWSDLTDLLIDWTEQGIRVEARHPDSPYLPLVTEMRIVGKNHDETCIKAREYFHTLFKKTERLEKAAGALVSGDPLSRKLIASRLRGAGSCRNATTEDIEWTLNEAHGIQNSLLYVGTERGCYGRAV
jgi:hypothetical protein